MDERRCCREVIIVDIDMPNSCSECPMCDTLMGYCMVATFGCPDRLIKDTSIRQSFCPIVGELNLDVKQTTIHRMKVRVIDPEEEKRNVALAKAIMGFDTDANVTNIVTDRERDDDGIDALNVRSGTGVGVRAYNALVYNTDIRTAREFVTKNVKISAVKSIKGVGSQTFDKILKFLEQHNIVPDYEKDIFVFTKGESK